MQKMNYLADAIGLLTLMLMVVILAAFVSPSIVPTPLWIPIYLAWAVGALFAWYKLEIVRQNWSLAVASSVGVAILWYGASRGIAYMTFRSGEPGLSKVFDVIVTLILSPGLTFVAIAGYVRDLVHRKVTRQS
jgi:hypothetical protein